MNKEKHSLRNLQHYNPGELLKEIPPYLTFDTKGANFENDIASEKWLWNQNTFIKIINLGVIFSMKLVIVSVTFFLGHPSVSQTHWNIWEDF